MTPHHHRFTIVCECGYRGEFDCEEFERFMEKESVLRENGIRSMFASRGVQRCQS